MPLLDDADLLARLVSFQSVSRNSNLPLATFICDYLDRPGVRIQRNPSPDGTKANLVISMGPEGDGRRRGLVLSGHMDVVPADEDGWHTDPFTLTEADGSYAGRGTADMKGFLALAINAAARLDPAALTDPLALVLTYDEEVGTLGARHFARTWEDAAVLPQSTIIGEPTSLRAIRMHKGHVALRLRVHGTAAHSAYPHLGRSAIEPVGRAIVALADLRRQLAKEHPANGEHFPEVPFVPLNMGRVAGGSAINVVPEGCDLFLDFRLLPGMDREPVLARIRDTLEHALGDARHDLEVLFEIPPMLLPDDAPVNRMLCDHIGQTETHSASYATDAGWLQHKGFQCVIWGPGSIEVAHKPNEMLPVSEFRRGAELIEGLLRRQCLGGEK